MFSVLLLTLHYAARTQSHRIELSPVFTIWSTDASDRKEPSGNFKPPHLNITVLEEIANLVGDRPVKVVSIVGGYHEGKSSFLNALLGADCFDVGERYEHETKGFNVVIRLDTNDALQPASLIIDTPGSGALDTSAAIQAANFGAAYLISSTLVYNKKGVLIDVHSLQNLADLLRTSISVTATIPGWKLKRLFLIAY